MKKLLKVMLKSLYYFSKNKNFREFCRLYDKYGNIKRYTIKRIKFLNYEFDVPDVSSFLWQFKKIFVEEIYKFQTDTDSSIIYDCSANIGMSTLLKILHPKSKIVAFEVFFPMGLMAEIFLKILVMVV